jgi:endonuclease/exonuclease/phosphatase family metal-dependent hydrolase
VTEPSRDEAGTIAADDFPFTIVNRAAWPPADVLRVAALNAQWGRRLDGVIACLRRPPLKGAGVILLAEADRNLRRSRNRDVAAEIAEALGMSFAYVPEFAPRGQMPHPISFLGNAILSAYPLAEVRTIELPNYRQPRRVRRLAGKPRGLAATITPNGRAVTIGVAHLSSRAAPAGRERQMARFLAELPEGPAIIGGDFNTTTIELARPRDVLKVMLLMAVRPWRFRRPDAYEPLFARLSEAGFRIDGANTIGRPTFTFSGAVPRWARPRLDWLALRGLRAMEGSAAVVAAKTGRFGRRVSDHDFVTCRVRV